MHARWRRDGRELFYVSPAGELFAASIKAGADLDIEPAHRLFQLPLNVEQRHFNSPYDVSGDGQHFLVRLRGTDQKALDLILNWPSLLPR